VALCGQGPGFGRARGLYRDAQRQLQAAFPPLPTREQWHRQRRHQPEALVAYFLPLVHLLAAQRCAYEALDSSGVPTRDVQRRGAGWWPGLADSGWRNRLGWDEGCHLRMAVNPVGVMTGLGFGPASTKAQLLAAPCFARPRPPHPGGPSVGAPSPWPLGGR
jgi:hypothetical protein